MRLVKPVQLGKVKNLATVYRNGEKASQLLVEVENGRRAVVSRLLGTIVCCLTQGG